MPTLDRRPQMESSNPEDEVLEEILADGTEEPSDEISSPEETSSEDEQVDASNDDEVITAPEEDEAAVDGPSEENETDTVEEARTALAELDAQRTKLRSEIVELRTERRTLRDKPESPLVVDRPVVKASEELSDIAEADLKVLEKFAHSRGLMTKEEFQRFEYDREVKTHQSAWMDEHPEYKPENDPNDEKWNQLHATVKMFQAPGNPKDVRRILDMAHRELHPAPQKAPLPTKSRAETVAAKEKLSVSSKTGGGGGSKTQAPKARSSVDLSHLKGFTPEELEEFSS